MTDKSLFSKKLIQEIKSAKEAKIIQKVKVGKKSKKNELVFFIKPELLEVEDNQKILNSFQLISEKFEDFNVKIHGAAIVPGATLEDYGIMNRHYGFINQLSRLASTMVDEETRQRIFESLGKKETEDNKIMGGHEFLQSFNTDVDTLSDIWFAQTANKLRSGFYFIADTFQDQPIILVNGFHPSQLLHFTRENHRILLLLIHTDADWFDLKFELVGDTFPEKAKPYSIRGALYNAPARYGQLEVGINTNGVHLSAGPFEAAYEVVNFFGPLIDLKPEKTPPLAIARAVEAGISQTQALSFLNNPAFGESDLFSKTENMNTKEAIELAKDHFE
ncbi:MAG: hypothetical protein RQ728_05460 [Brevefilum sp.]|nr:hypothetical protein [Brevefilum sp.]MDT8381687.1 hypothetical protein [Brevefilum sp.]MDW7755836.1 hypothetical protein [Brevefilum sp.]